MELEENGYIVHHVTSGEDAVKTILDDSLSFDLILMDIDLGTGIDGTQSAENKRLQAFQAFLTIIIESRRLKMLFA